MLMEMIFWEKVSQNRKNTVIYNWILGSKSDLFRTYCYAFRIANIGMVLLVLWKMLKKRNQDVNQVFYTLSFLGGVCFYSIWEIKASYGMPFLMFLFAPWKLWNGIFSRADERKKEKMYLYK